MTPEQIRASDDRPISILCALTPCLCAGGEVPCLKHYRAAFEVWFCAKYGVGPFDAGIRKSDGRLRCWLPLTINTACYDTKTLNGVKQDDVLRYRLHLPAVISEDYGQWGWCLSRRRHDSFPLARGQKLSRVAQRYVQRVRRPTWSKKKKSR